MKVLILKRDKLGDLLLTTPLFRALREQQRDARIDLLASQYNAWVAEGNRHLDRILSYRRVRVGKRVSPRAVLEQARLFLQLRREQYDVVIVAQGEDSPRAVERALWTGARRVISYVDGTHRYGSRLTDPLALPGEAHEAARLLGLLRPLGIDATLRDVAPEFHLPPVAAQFASEWLSRHQLAPQRYAVLGLGARRPRKQPTAEQIVRWIARLHDTHALATVFMWTPGDKDNALYPGDDATATAVLDAAPPGLVPFRGPLIPALGLIWSARTSIFPDSGLMHFASASPGAVVGLFGDAPDFAEKWRPLGTGSRHLVAAQVSDIADDDVFAALAAVLAARSG